MYNWNIDTATLKRDNEKYTIWKLEQLINFGLDGEKLNADLLKKYWSKLKIDPRRRKLLAFWLWPQKS